MNDARKYIFGHKDKSLMNGLIAYWKLDGDLLDAYSTHNGTATSISYATGKNNNGINFTGAGQTADFGSSTDFQFSDGVSVDYPFSIRYWVKYTVVGGFDINMRKTNGGFLSYVGSAGVRPRFVISSNAAFTNYLLIEASADQFAINNWYHVFMTYDGSKTNAGMKIYINGVAIGTVNMNAGTYTVMNNTGASNVILTQTVSTTRKIIDEVDIYNRVLTLYEIQKDYNTGAGNFYPL